MDVTKPRHRTRRLTVLAQDPGVRSSDGSLVTAEIEVLWERLEPGPKGHRVHVIDYDASTDTLYKPWAGDLYQDRYKGVQDPEKLLADPHFHAQNVYAIAMSTLALFEAALGRRVHWAFESNGHQMKIAPHAFAEANAFYSRATRACSSGTIPGKEGQTVFTCLSHDIVCHEASHALLDALRRDFMRPSSSDQAAFHEGFSDVVALLSVLGQKELVERVLKRRFGRNRKRLSCKELNPDRLAESALLGLAEEMGQHMGAGGAAVRSDALRRSIKLNEDDLDREEFEAPHRRGEILVAAMMKAFLEVWVRRLGPLGFDQGLPVDVGRVVEEANEAARQLATIAIRAIDYAPPVNLDFSDYLSAILTADMELVPDDSKYGYRDRLRESFKRHRIKPAKKADGEGYWCRPECEVSCDQNHFAQLQRDPDEVFRFLWENRKALELDCDAFTRVRSVRPVVRIGPDGFIQHETVAVYLQTLVVRASDLKRIQIDRPKEMSNDVSIHLYGGGTLIFDEFGRLKFHIGSGVRSRHQSERLKSLWERGEFDPHWTKERRFTRLHRLRAFPYAKDQAEYW